MFIPSSSCPPDECCDLEVLGCISTPTGYLTSQVTLAPATGTESTWEWDVHLFDSGNSIVNVWQFDAGTQNPLPGPYPAFPATLPGGAGWVSVGAPFPLSFTFPTTATDRWAVVELSSGASVWFYFPFGVWASTGAYPAPVQGVWLTTTGVFPVGGVRYETANGITAAIDLTVGGFDATVKIIQRQADDGASYEIQFVYAIGAGVDINGDVVGTLVSIPAILWTFMSLGQCGVSGGAAVLVYNDCYVALVDSPGGEFFVGDRIGHNGVAFVDPLAGTIDTQLSTIFWFNRSRTPTFIGQDNFAGTNPVGFIPTIGQFNDVLPCDQEPLIFRGGVSLAHGTQSPALGITDVVAISGKLQSITVRARVAGATFTGPDTVRVQLVGGSVINLLAGEEATWTVTGDNQILDNGSAATVQCFGNSAALVTWTSI